MRIWDINPGYLNKQSLLAEHRELHEIVSFIMNRKKDYSKLPETLRWLDYGWALTTRHSLLAAEMDLRNYRECSSVNLHTNEGLWPPVYIDQPSAQFKVLSEKYRSTDKGRIKLPRTGQELWRHHKYSIMARDIGMYKEIGRKAAKMHPKDDFSELARILTEKLRCAPSSGGIKNALQHMWGYVSDSFTGSRQQISSWSIHDLLNQTQKIAVRIGDPYLMSSTALSELKVWL